MNEVYAKVYLLRGDCNAYYIDDKIKVLVDAGFDFKGVVDILVITHVHPDHIFFAKKIQDRTKCKVLIGEGDKDIPSLVGFCPLWKGEKVEVFIPDKLLKDGDIIKSGEYSFKVLGVPGHSKGSIALFEKEHGILLSGDTLFADGIIGRTDFPHSIPTKMKSSLEILQNMKYKILLPGHGRIDSKL